MYESFLSEKLPPRELDALLAEGWRHVGNCFYRKSLDEYDNQSFTVLPLRIDLEGFTPSKSQRRILRRNLDLEVRIGRFVIDDERDRLFQIHAKRFSFAQPDCLENFLGYYTEEDIPCRVHEISVRDPEGRLLAASYVSIGEVSHSSIYAMFDPTESSRSLGNATILWEIEAARAAGCRWLYPGYAHVESSFYDYKKRFCPLQWYDWEMWRPEPLPLQVPGGHGDSML
jgi:arginine-tRNA-protein transferase